MQIIQDHGPLYGVLDDTKDKTKGIEKLLDRDQFEEMAKRDLEKTRTGELAKPKKK